MSLKEFDWKKFLLMKGELLVLGMCGIAALTVVGLSLFMPGHGFFTGSGAANAATLEGLIANVEGLLKNNKPGETDNPPKANKVDLTSAAITDRAKYQLKPLFEASPTHEKRRRVPDLLLPDQGTVDIALAQLKRYIFSGGEQDPRLMVLEDRKATTNATVTQVGNALSKGRSSSMFGAGAGGRQRGSNRSFGMTNAQGVASANSTKPELESKFVLVEKLKDLSNVRLAESPLPLRMAIIAASFPYRKQIEEFMKQLQLPDAGSVLGETLTDGENSYPSFRFMGVRAERRQVDSEGKPIPNLDWEPLNLEQSYKDYLIMNGKRVEPEDGSLDAISFRGLVMRRLPQFRENQYPEVETRLENIQKTLEVLNAKEAEPVVTPTIFETGDIDIFGAGEPTSPAAGRNRRASGPGGPGGQGRGEGMNNRAAGTARMERGQGGPGGSRGPAGRGQPGGNAAMTSTDLIPEYCLVRLIDVTIVPGKIYQYRIKVRMANPNYGRQDVASPIYATDKELTTNDWFVIPDKVFVPPELIIYAVDQKEIDGPREYAARRGPYANATLEKGRQIALQVHRWLEWVDEPGARPIGEWVVAERMLIYRGEYISRKLRCEVPEWKTTREEFILASESSNKARNKESGITINFSQPESENNAVLVDFEGGELEYVRESRRTEDGAEPARGRDKSALVKDKAPVEVLILSPEGKLLSHDTTVDARDEVRVKRLKAYQDRVEEVKEGKSSGTSPATKSSPFGRN